MNNFIKKQVLHIIFYGLMLGFVPQACAMNPNPIVHNPNENLQPAPALKRIYLRDSKSWQVERLLSTGMVSAAALLAKGLILPTKQLFSESLYISRRPKFLPISAIGFTCGILCATIVFAAGFAATANALALADTTYKNHLNSEYNMRGLFNPNGVRQILDVDIHQRDEHGTTLLMYCSDLNSDYQLPVEDIVTSGQLSVVNRLSLVRALIAAGADINAVDNEGKSALYWAMMRTPPHVYLRTFSQTLNMLLVAGADVTPVLTQLKQEQRDLQARIAELPAGVEMSFQDQRLQQKLNLFIPILEHPEHIFIHGRKPERHLYRDLLCKRATVIKDPSLQEAVNQYERTGFEHTLKKWCLNDNWYQGLQEQANQRAALPVEVVDVISSFASKEKNRQELLTRAIDIAASKDNQKLVDMLRACGAQHSVGMKYRSFDDEFHAYDNVLPVPPIPPQPDIVHNVATTLGN